LVNFDSKTSLHQATQSSNTFTSLSLKLALRGLLITTKLQTFTAEI